MSRVVAVSLVVACALVAMLAGMPPSGLNAQEATPAAAPNFVVGQLAPIGQEFEVLPGVDIEFLIEGQPAAASGQGLVLYRITFREGEVPAHIHPGTTVATVESGELSWTLLAGTVSITRPGSAPEVVSEPGTEIIVGPGEGLFYNDDVVHSARAAGEEPVVALVTVLFELGQPALTLTDEHGTPLAMGTPAA